MSFFDDVNTQDTEFELGGGDLPPIPKGTRVLAAIEQISNDYVERSGETLINAMWRIARPAEYANRVLFQKIRVYDADQAKALKAKKMLAAIANNAGGKLFTEMQSRSEQTPSDQSLSVLCQRPMALELEVWKMKNESGEEMTGNWVNKVAPAKSGAAQQQAPVNPMAQQQAAATAAPASPVQSTPPIDFDDDIPFAPLGLQYPSLPLVM